MPEVQGGTRVPLPQAGRESGGLVRPSPTLQVQNLKAREAQAGRGPDVALAEQEEGGVGLGTLSPLGEGAAGGEGLLSTFWVLPSYFISGWCAPHCRLAGGWWLEAVPISEPDSDLPFQLWGPLRRGARERARGRRLLASSHPQRRKVG